MQWFWSPESKVSHFFHCFPIYLPWSDGTRCHDLHFLNAEEFFHSPLSLSGIPISRRIFQFVVIYTVKGFGVINRAEVDIFLVFSCFFDDPTDVGNLISAFSKTRLNIWKFMVHIMLKPGLENFEHYIANMWDECNCAVVWAFFGIVFLWNWNENWPLPVLWPLLSFPSYLAFWVQHCNSIIFWDLKWLSWNSITSTSFGMLPKAHLTSHARM